MEPIRKLAIDFKRTFERYNTLEKIDSEINSKLIYISKNSEKLRFLSYIKDIAETEYKEHIKVCQKPNTCQANQSYENALYVINQQYDDYSEIENGIKYEERPSIQFFADGQYFDAYSSIKELIKKAQTSIMLIDRYVDESTLAFFPSKEPVIKLRILTDKKSISEEFDFSCLKYNKQYENLKISTTKNFHDRFLIVDNKDFYHIGASIKDAGNKSFLYSIIEDEDVKNTIREKIKKEWKDIDCFP